MEARYGARDWAVKTSFARINCVGARHETCAPSSNRGIFASRLAEGGQIIAFLHRDCETAPVRANTRGWIIVGMWTRWRRVRRAQVDGQHAKPPSSGTAMSNAASAPIRGASRPHRRGSATYSTRCRWESASLLLRRAILASVADAVAGIVKRPHEDERRALVTPDEEALRPESRQFRASGRARALDIGRYSRIRFELGSLHPSSRRRYPETVASGAGGTGSRLICPVRDSPGEFLASGA